MRIKNDNEQKLRPRCIDRYKQLLEVQLQFRLNSISNLELSYEANFDPCSVNSQARFEVAPEAITAYLPELLPVPTQLCSCNPNELKST